MRPTRRAWAAAGLALLLAILAVVLARPLLLAGTATVGAWLLARQYRFWRALSRTVDALAVEQAPATASLHTGTTAPVTLAADLDAPASVPLALEAGVPAAAACDERLAVRLAPGETTARRTAEVAWPVAGRHAFAPVELTADGGPFRETLSVGPTPTVVVEPRGPRRVHVGAGGDRVAAAHGDHAAGRSDAGLVPAEVREYVPGDTAATIDWKATARLGTPHVREYEAETDRPTTLVVDHRGGRSLGPPRETQLDYLREVALAVAASARRLGDPLGAVTVDAAGPTTRLEPASGPNHYARVRRELLTLEPGETDARRSAGAAAQPTLDAAPTPFVADDAPGTAAFERTLAPFLGSRRPATRLDADAAPLVAAVRAATARGADGGWIALFADDSDPAELREAVRVARAAGYAVTAFLAPTALFEPGALADAEATYGRYVAFERVRRDLDRLDRVRALEVAPGDRLASVLAAGRDRTRGERR